MNTLAFLFIFMLANICLCMFMGAAAVWKPWPKLLRQRAKSFRFDTVRWQIGVHSMEKRSHFVELVEAKAEELLQKWSDVFVLNKPVKPEVLTRRIK